MATRSSSSLRLRMRSIDRSSHSRIQQTTISQLLSIGSCPGFTVFETALLIFLQLDPLCNWVNDSTDVVSRVIRCVQQTAASMANKVRMMTSSLKFQLHLIDNSLSGRLESADGARHAQLPSIGTVHIYIDYRIHISLQDPFSSQEFIGEFSRLEFFFSNNPLTPVEAAQIAFNKNFLTKARSKREFPLCYFSDNYLLIVTIYR